MRAAEYQRIRAARLYVREIALSDEPHDLVVVRDEPVLDERYELRARRLVYLNAGVGFKQFFSERATADCCRRRDDSDFLVSGYPDRLARGAVDHSEYRRFRILRAYHIDRGRAHGSAGYEDRVHFLRHEKIHVLKGVFDYRLPRAAAVRDPSGVAEIDYILAGDEPPHLLERGQPAESAVKDADQIKAPFRAPDRQGGR